MKTFSLLLAVLFTASCSAQNNAGSALLKVHEQTIASSGIPKLINPKTDYQYENSVFNSILDKEENIWFGTTQGVYCFDGKLFYNYKTMDGLNVESVSCMLKDNSGKIWFGTAGGVIKYDGGTFSSLRLPDEDANSLFIPIANNFQNKNSVGEIIQDKTGVFWLATTKHGVYRYDPSASLSTGSNALIHLPLFDCPDENGTCSMYKDSKGNLWFVKGGCGICHYSYRLDAAKANDACINGTCKHDLNNANNLAAHNKEIENSFTKVTTAQGKNIDYTTFIEDKNGTIWFGTWDSGVYQYDGKNFTHFAGKEGMNTSYIESMLQDKNGNIWFATGYKSDDGFAGNGAFRYDGKTVTHYTSKDGLNTKGVFVSNSASGMLEDSEGKIWFISDGGGVSCYNGKTFTAYSTKDGLTSDNVLTVTQDNNGNLWFGTWGFGICRYDAFTNRFVSYTL